MSRIQVFRCFVILTNIGLASDHFGKLQSALLICVMYYWPSHTPDVPPPIKPAKRYLDFVSSDLDHSSLFFQKAVEMAIGEARECAETFERLYLVTDGSSREFFNKYNIYAAGIYQHAYGKCCHILH
jgi:hypothetical protein